MAHYGSNAGGPEVVPSVWRHHVGKIVGHENGQWIIQSGNDGMPYGLGPDPRGAIASGAPEPEEAARRRGRSPLRTPSGGLFRLCSQLRKTKTRRVTPRCRKSACEFDIINMDPASENIAWVSALRSRVPPVNAI